MKCSGYRGDPNKDHKHIPDRSSAATLLRPLLVVVAVSQPVAARTVLLYTTQACAERAAIPPRHHETRTLPQMNRSELFVLSAIMVINHNRVEAQPVAPRKYESRPLAARRPPRALRRPGPPAARNEGEARRRGVLLGCLRCPQCIPGYACPGNRQTRNRAFRSACLGTVPLAGVRR